MSKKVESGYVKADSGNLPKVNIFMVLDYVKNDERFNDPEVRNSKMNDDSRETYGDAAIGYVCLKRDENLCVLKASVCPEHKVRDTPYKVTLIINEVSCKVNTVECHDCPASLGGCKHAIALLMWANRRTEEPAPTEVKCYWKKSTLAKITDPDKFIAAVDLFEGRKPKDSIISTSEIDPEKMNVFFQNVCTIAKERMIDSQLTRHLFDLDGHMKAVSLHHLAISFLELNKSDASEFLKFVKKNMNHSMFEMVENKTRSQSDDPFWYECRYGRITASIIHEAAHCQTSDGSLVKKVIGAAKIFQSKAMKRGKDLENNVLLEVKQKEKISCNSCGLFLLSTCPIIGASPDAIGSDFTVEIKCPSSTDNIKNYLSNGNISDKCKAQMYTQMLCAQKPKGLFCVADPLFEQNKKVTTVWLKYDKNFLTTIKQTINFWKENIYPRLVTSAK